MTKNKITHFLVFVFLMVLTNSTYTSAQEKAASSHQDTPFLQDYSIKYYFEHPEISLKKVASDRNGKIQVLSSDGLLHTKGGAFLYPGTLVSDGTYRPFLDKNLSDLIEYDQQFVYLDDEAALSNAWAGSLFTLHGMPQANMFAAGADFSFLIADNHDLKFIQDTLVLWSGSAPEGIVELTYLNDLGLFGILTSETLFTFSPNDKELVPLFNGNNFTSFDSFDSGSQLVIGTSNGYLFIDATTGNQVGEVVLSVPVPEITKIKVIEGNLWFGSTNGAFMARGDGKYNYYQGERWLPGNEVIDMAKGPENSVLILTSNGIGHLCFKEITLHDKARYFEKQVRLRHIRNGFNATLSGLEKGDLSTGYLADSDNDGLWTSMYLASQAYRYAVTGSEEALQNCIESLDAMERLYTINPVPGFPARSFERSGYMEVLADPERWQHSPDPEWDWKATTSSDEAIGHAFVFGVIAELVQVDTVRDKAIRLLDELMQHIVDNDLYLVDYDGKPTTWARWNPEYVNALPVQVGDRKLNSSNIVAMLQTAYHFTGKEIYKETAFDLMENHGYLENLMRPIGEIGPAPDDASDWAKMLSQSWNHSDDEMYFLGYWGLYRYAFTDSLREMFRESILDHWEYERPEKDGLWNIFTAMVSDQFDLEEAIWFLQEYPLDLINWDVLNSHRKDIQPIPENFRQQTIEEVLPPDELPIRRHNANRFGLDRGNGGHAENSAGDIWLLPYWLGRYLNVIDAGRE